MKNSVKKQLHEGKITSGAWLQLVSPLSAEILAKAGFDWLMIDMEHAPGDITTLLSQVQAMSSCKAIPFVRAPWNDAVIIKRILDTGVMGILIPYVNTKAEAEHAVKACKYPPAGIRGVAGSTRAAGFGQNSMDYLSSANEEILVITAIETPEAVNNLDGILSVPDLDGLFIGPMDLSASMGYMGDIKHLEVQKAIRKIEEKTLSAGKFLGTVAGSWDDAQSKYERGYQLLTLMSDSVCLADQAQKTVSRINKKYR
jgi:2-keto-3-deoxy-L-rhamnonate aldolase RhmA